MYRFYVEIGAIDGQKVRLTDEDNNHIRNVLRMKAGDEIIVCDGYGKDYHCRLEELSKDRVEAKILSMSLSYTELPVRIVLFQGMPKKDKMEFIIQKAVELGVAEVIPVNTKRTVVRLEDEKKEQKKLERWQAIAKAAAMQSMRGIVPQIGKVCSFTEALEYAKQLDAAVIPYENARGIAQTRKVISELAEKRVRSVGIFIGPEGGFSEDEIQKAMEDGILPITLGKRILRTETAGMTVLSLIMYHLESD